MSTQRQAAMTAGILALSLVSTIAGAQSVQPQQRGGPPKPDTKSILVTAFHSPDQKLGVETANELRSRLQSEHSASELFVVLKQNIDNTLQASGYRPDSALNASDVMELAKQLRGDYVVDGTVTREGSGARLDARILMKTGNQTLAQPLPAITGKDAGDLAGKAEREISAFTKGMPAYNSCTADLRGQKYAEAEKEARAGIAIYPNSALNRLCLLSAYSYNKASPDSIIALANNILAVDSSSTIALANLADAYKAKGMNDKLAETNLRIYRADPKPEVGLGIINDLVQAGQQDKALQVVNDMLKDNPADPNFLSTKWKILLNAKQWKSAIAAGNDLVRIDTAQATADFFNRQINAAQQDSDAAMVATMAQRASAKFPQETSYPLLLAQSYARQQNYAESWRWSRRALEIDPKNQNAYQFALVSAAGQKWNDSVSAIAQKAIAAGVDKTIVGGFLLGPTADALRKAQESKTRDDWKAALTAAQGVDAIAPTPQSKFYVGVTSFSLGQDYANELTTLAKSKKKADLEQACTDAKAAEDAFATTAISMPGGGSVDKNVAGQILGALGQYGPFIDQAKKAFCKP